MIRLLKGDVISFARHYKGPRFHAILCDPPYELSFMNKNWDSTGIAFNPETWAALGEHLLPGAFGMAFASSRGWHRLAVAIEDAGMRIHPSIFGWAYGSGFPKSTRIDTQVDQRGGLPISHTEIAQAIKQAREKRGLTAGECDKRFCNGTTNWTWYEGRPRGINIPDGETFRQIANAWPELESYAKAVEAAEREVIGISNNKIHLENLGHAGYQEEWNITLPATELAQTWQHHRYGLQAMKPSLEPIIVFQKPYSGKPVDSIVATGAGAINIDKSRITGAYETRDRDTSDGASIFGTGRGGGEFVQTSGRWPSNFVLSHTPDCVQVGTREVKAEDRSRPPRTPNMIYGGGKGTNLTAFESPVPTNGTEQIANWQCAPECPIDKMNKAIGKTKDGEYHGKARFFFQSDWHHEIAERLAEADPVRYQAKASRRERDAGLQGMPTLTVDELSGGGGHSQEYQTKYQARKSPRRNPHPTLKPIELCRWLATLLLPPDAYAPRRILVPFAGTASEMIGAGLAGWEHIVGIELSMENVLIGEARLNHWLYQPQQGALL